jgi:hypothetical protein
MKPEETTQQVIDFQKQVIENWNAAVALAEDQATSTLGLMLDTAVWMPVESRRAVAQWMTVLKEERGRLQSQLDQGLAVVEKIFGAPQAPSTAKPKNTPINKKKETPNESV